MTAQRAAAELRVFADAIDSGTVRVPAMRYAELNGSTLRIIPRVLHDVLCEVRIATPQEGSNPLVSHCAFCGFCYPHRSVDSTGMTTGLTAADGAVRDEMFGRKPAL